MRVTSNARSPDSCGTLNRESESPRSVATVTEGATVAGVRVREAERGFTPPRHGVVTVSHLLAAAGRRVPLLRVRGLELPDEELLVLALLEEIRPGLLAYYEYHHVLKHLQGHYYFIILNIISY